MSGRFCACVMSDRSQLVLPKQGWTRLLIALATAAALNGAGRVAAADGAPGACLPPGAQCGEKVCVTSAGRGKATRHCWDVECSDVCIPAVRFPWECGWSGENCDRCGTPCPLPGRCGKVRCVRKLKEVDYECDVCEYEHQIVCRTSEDASADEPCAAPFCRLRHLCHRPNHSRAAH